jgi:hypothetical protein
MAHRLEASGCRVGAVVLLDAPGPWPAGSPAPTDEAVRAFIEAERASLVGPRALPESSPELRLDGVVERTRSLVSYRPAPTDRRIHLLRAADRSGQLGLFHLAERPDFGWGAVAERLGLEHAGSLSAPTLESLRSAGTETPSGRLVIDIERLRQSRAAASRVARPDGPRPAGGETSSGAAESPFQTYGTLRSRQSSANATTSCTPAVSIW